MSELLGEGRVDKGGMKNPPATERPSWQVYGQKLSGYQRPDEQELAKAIRVLKAKGVVCEAAKGEQELEALIDEKLFSSYCECGCHGTAIDVGARNKAMARLEEARKVRREAVDALIKAEEEPQ